MKKIYITEAQMSRLLETAFNSYLDKENVGNGVEDNTPVGSVSHNEVGINGRTDDSIGEPVDTDDIATAMVPGYGSHYGMNNAHGRMGICEVNQSFDGKDIVIPSHLMGSLQAAYSSMSPESTGYQRMQNLLKNGSVTTNDAYRIMHDYKNKEYNKTSGIPRELINWLKTHVKSLENSSRLQKKAKERRGVNAYQKEGGTKTGTGTAKSKKDTGVVFNYEN